jgi:hypothetical protein
MWESILHGQLRIFFTTGIPCAGSFLLSKPPYFMSRPSPEDYFHDMAIRLHDALSVAGIGDEIKVQLIRVTLKQVARDQRHANAERINEMGLPALAHDLCMNTHPQPR